jgi:hypothetical protein
MIKSSKMKVWESTKDIRSEPILLMSGDKHESEKGLLKAVDKLQK